MSKQFVCRKLTGKMIEIFKNSNYDFIGKGKCFLGIAFILTILGVCSIVFKGFNLGIDFSGGTLVNVRFEQPCDDDRLRSALSNQGIDISKVIIQTINNQIGETPKNEVLIRLPQTSVPQPQASEQYKQDINDNKQHKEDIADNKTAITKALYKFYSQTPSTTRANKIDVNNSNQSIIKEALITALTSTPQTSITETELEKLAKHIINYRDTQRNGLITDVAEIPLGGFSPQLSNIINANLYADDFSIVNAEIVGPQAGKDLRNRTIYVTSLALLGMLIYIAYRFEWIYGISAVLAVVHDVIITLAFFSFFGWEISLNVIAALLTLIGYSMNDTIVIFDRIREQLCAHPHESITKLSNDAINETLSRTLITSGLTFFSVLALVLFGGPVLRGFSLALFIGIIIGTYSSIAIATPIMLWGRQFIKKPKPITKDPATEDPATTNQTTKDPVTDDQ